MSPELKPLTEAVVNFRSAQAQVLEQNRIYSIHTVTTSHDNCVDPDDTIIIVIVTAAAAAAASARRDSSS